jgi:hypothetical protein
LLGIWTIRCTAKIEAWIEKAMAALRAFAGWIILEKLYFISAFWALCLKNCTGFPELHILSGTFHFLPP